MPITVKWHDSALAYTFLHVTADAEPYAKLSLGNWLAVSGGNPEGLREQLPDVLQHTAKGWSPLEDILEK